MRRFDQSNAFSAPKKTRQHSKLLAAAMLIMLAIALGTFFVQRVNAWCVDHAETDDCQ